MTTSEIRDTSMERAVVGGVLMLGADALHTALNSGLDYGDFYDERLRLVFKTTVELAKADTPIDFLTVRGRLGELGYSDKVDPAFLSGLTEGIPAALNVQAYAEKILVDSRRRRIRQASSAVLASENGDMDAAVADLARVLAERPQRKAEHRFRAIAEDRYCLEVPELGAELEVDRLRRERNELVAELSVRCSLPGVRSYDGSLSIADFNLSSARARKERASLLADRAGSRTIDWSGHLEELCQRVLATERAGQPAVDLRTIPKPEADDGLSLEGLLLPRRHPAILFGDGGAAKSYLGLYLAGRLAERGFRVGLWDWELAGEDHRDRLERLFGPLAMPKILYARCERPLVHEVDRLRRIARDEAIDYAVFDSIAFACDGPPESAEIAGKYFRAVRQIGGGSLHIAHITKSEGGDQKPFGSVFWHNGARATYFVKLAEEASEGNDLHIGLYNRKINLGRLQSPTGFKILFDQNRTSFTREDPADTPDLAERMPIRERMRHLLRGGAMPVEKIAEETGAKPETIKRTIRRGKNVFTVLEGGKVGLAQ